MQFSRELRESVVAGEITLTYRLWGRPQVRVGGRYQVGPAHIEVDSVELVPFCLVTEADLELAGEHDLESLRRRTAHAGPVHDDTLVYRIEFHVV
ncbi:MAG: ASCH domain-containing protein [Actinobacteria bacterium]|nr:ASCH domain-containing protein [Actinomycetota bacterium]